MPGEHFGANIKPFCSVSARKEQRARLQLQIVPEEYQMSFRKNHRKSCQNDWKLFAGMHHLPVDCPYMNSETARLKKSKAHCTATTANKTAKSNQNHAGSG